MKSHNKYKNVILRLECMLINTSAQKTKAIKFALRTAFNCLKSQKKHIDKLENEIESLKCCGNCEHGQLTMSQMGLMNIKPCVKCFDNGLWEAIK